MAEDDSNEDVSDETQSTKRASKIPVRINSNTSASKSTTKVIIVDTSRPSKSVSRIPIRTSKSGSAIGLFKIKLINSSKSASNVVSCECKKGNDDEEELEMEEDDSAAKICEICNCDSGICNQACLQAKKARTKRFMDQSSMNTTVDRSKSKCNNVKKCNCVGPCTKDCEEKKKLEKKSCDDNKNNKATKSNDESSDICPICKCAKPCKLNCEGNKNKNTNAPPEKTDVCEDCKCQAACNKYCELNKTKLAEEAAKKAKNSGKICEDCKCVNPCNDNCLANKKRIAEEEANRKNIAKDKICAVCLCKKPCNEKCEANKRKLAENEAKKSKSAGKVCEICKCTKPCNRNCEENKKQAKKLICANCQCATPCNDACEAKKEADFENEESENLCAICKNAIKPSPKVCAVCKCVKPCGKECEIKKTESSRKSKSVCEVCKCRKPCNNDCEEKKAQEVKKIQVEEICKCIKACMDAVEASRASNKSTEKLEKQFQETYCEICKCSGGCTKECEEKKQEKLDARNTIASLNKVNSEKSASSSAKLEVIEEQPEVEGEEKEIEPEEEPMITCVEAEILEDDKRAVCEICKCTVDACHAICDEIKKLRNEITKPKGIPCEVCECSPDNCNETCLENARKSAQTLKTISTSNAECATDDINAPCEPCSALDVHCNDSKGELPQLVNELASVISDIKCSCKKAESITKKHCRETDSELRLIIKHLQQKCKMKDIFIDAMISDLSQRGTSKVFDGLLQKIACNTNSVCDFDRTAIANALPRPDILSCNDLLKSKKTFDCECPKGGSGEDLDGFRIIVVKVVGPSLLIRWISSPNLCVIGYHVYVNGKVRGRVFSRLRTSVLLDCLDLKQEMKIEVYAMTKDGKTEPPAVKFFKACAC